VEGHSIKSRMLREKEPCVMAWVPEDRMVADSRLKINLEESFLLDSLLMVSWLAWQCHCPCLGNVLG
jgi:hypothetical protein